MPDASSTARRVLIVIPTLGRRPELFAETVQSITQQKDEPADLVVVVPRDAEVVRQLALDAGARLVDDPGGMSAAINAGFALADEESRVRELDR